MSKLSMMDVRCTALFVSGLQRSDAPAADAVVEAVRVTVRQFGVLGCAARMAQEFGDHPETAADRMRWIRQLAGEIPARPYPAPAARARRAHSAAA
jgi:hypothetical protein